jgi:signal transduction histidine kinase
MPSVSTEMLQHTDAAFWSANALSVIVAVLAALLACVVASYSLSRRLRRSTRSLVTAATEVAGGRYDVRVRADGLGAEFEELIDAFNQMAARLGRSEAARRRLLADVTHELRTPVATLNAYVEGLEDGIETLDADTCLILKAQATRISRLTDDMAAVSVAEENGPSLRRQRTMVTDLVHSAVAAFGDRYAGKGVRLEVRLSAALPLVYVDPDRIGQVLANVLDNALRHTSPGGNVTLSADEIGTDVVLRIQDCGEGIGAEDLSRVFDRFYRADPARTRAHGDEGSGLGLAISRSLIEAHGGRIHARSDGLGHGSTFTVTLPTRRLAGGFEG